MNFKTPVHVGEFKAKIEYKSKVLLLGSCFSNEIGQKLHDLKYKVIQNPCGITFNAQSILTCIKRCKSSNSLPQSELFLSHGLYNHYDFHGVFSDPDLQIATNQINSSLKMANEELQNVEYVIITIGTAWVFRHKSTGAIVNNCHKQPSELFDRILMSEQEINRSFVESRELLKTHSNKNVRFIITLSPIRHIRDGLVENQRSKAIALTAIHNFVDTYEDVEYFPSYELVLDELRDYRFYNADMIHPTPQAVDFIYDKFENAVLDPNEKSIRDRVSKIMTSVNHRPIHADTKTHEDFVRNTLSKMQNLENEFEYLAFEQEREKLKSRIDA